MYIKHIKTMDVLKNPVAHLSIALKCYSAYFYHYIIEYNRIICLYDSIIRYNNNYNLKFKHACNIYDNIISSLDNYKIKKTQFMESEFNKYIKYCNYAEEQCIIQEKLLLSISQINKYCNELNDIAETIIIEPIQKHIFLISTYTIIIYPSFKFRVLPVSRLNDEFTVYPENID
jgi:hypothetical protein